MTTQRIYSADEAAKREATLPPEVRAFLYSPEMLNSLKSIGDKNHLHIDQLALLQTEVSAVMLGFTEPDDFVEMLVENLHVEKAQAELIAKDINELVFLKIREAMKNLPKNTPAPAPATAATPIQAPTPAPVAAPALKALEPHPADLMLSQKTVSVAPPMPAPAPQTAPAVAPKPEIAKTEPPKPQPYKADPYREPTN